MHLIILEIFIELYKFVQENYLKKISVSLQCKDK